MNTTTITTPGTHPTGQTDRSIWSTGLRAGLIAAAATELFATAARVVGVPMRAGSIGAAKPQTLPPGWVALATLFCVLLGLALATVIQRVTSRPRRVFLIASCVLTAISFVSPIGAGATTLATKLILAFTHIIAAAIMIPAISKQLPDTRTKS
jgi:Family of unknown function (DUF6069)